MKTKKENPVLLLLKWAEKDRGFLIASVICAFLGGLLAIGPYIGIYRLMDAFLTDTCSIQVISENAVLITATVIIRQVFQGLSGIFSHKGAYGALFRVRCMITEHLSKVPLGALDERRTGDIKTVLNEDIEKLELCLAHNIPELVGFATGPVVIFIYLMTINVPLAMISLIPLGITLIIMVGCFAFMAGMMPHVTEAMANFNSVIIEYINGMKLWNVIDYPHWRAVIFEWFNYSKHFSVVCVYWLSILIGIVASSAIIYGTGTIIKRRQKGETNS